MDKRPDIPPRTSSKEDAKDQPSATPSSSKEDADRNLTIPIPASSQAATGNTPPPKTPSPQKGAASQDEVDLPDRYSDRLTPKERRKLRKHRSKIQSARTVTLTPQSTVPEFMDNRGQVYDLTMNYRRAYEKFLQLALSRGKLTNAEYQEEMDRIQELWAPWVQEQKVFEKQRRTLEQDVEEAYASEKRQKTASEANVEFLRRAYSTAMRIRGMSAGKQQKQHFNHGQFRKDVISFYQASSTDEFGKKELWCHLTGWRDADDVKAAHLVPKLYQGEELKYLFGDSELVLAKPNNSLTLHKRIEEGLDSGTIAIVPVPPADEEHSYKKWKCVLVKENMRKQTVGHLSDPPPRWGDYDGKELEFLSDNRPARRYLYFRFILTYLQSDYENNINWLEKVENRKELWASSGPYLERSTLQYLAKNLTGKELPPPIYQGNTFESKEPAGTNDISVASHIREAIMTTAKHTKAEDAGWETSDEDADDEEDDFETSGEEEEVE